MPGRHSQGMFISWDSTPGNRESGDLAMPLTSCGALAKSLRLSELALWFIKWREYCSSHADGL